LIQHEFMRTIGCYIGIFEINDFNSRSDIILRNASVAAENQYDNRMFGRKFYDEVLDKKIRRESEIKEELIYEMNHLKHLSCQFQPIFDVEGKKIHSFEALARFHSTSLGDIPPLEFIPIAEETQLIIPLGKHILEMACDFIASVHKMGHDDIKVAVNVSIIQLLANHFIEDVLKILEKKNISPSALNLEITESVFTDNFDYVNSVLNELRGHGISIFIDDFGTGYSSLSRETELSIDSVKIDKFFIQKLVSLAPQEAITGDIISMVHKLGHLVVAEGVEYEDQRQYLIDHGCDLIQGYYYGKPMDALSALKLLEEKPEK